MEGCIMKMYDLGITIIVAVIVLLGSATLIHKYRNKNEVSDTYEEVEDTLEVGVDYLLDLPLGTTDKVTDHIFDSPD